MLQPNHVNLTILQQAGDTFDQIERFTTSESHKYPSLQLFIHEDAIEFVPRNVSKASALNLLKSSLQLSNDATICVGDGENDACLISECSHMIIVGNGLCDLVPVNTILYRTDTIVEAIEQIKKIL